MSYAKTMKGQFTATAWIEGQEIWSSVNAASNGIIRNASTITHKRQMSNMFANIASLSMISRKKSLRKSKEQRLKATSCDVINQSFI